MTWHSTKELYGMFLRSDWWIALSRTKRRSVGKCEQCGDRRCLQAHHVRYPENWFDTGMEDLKVLCRDCHESEHHITKVVFHPNSKGQRKAFRNERRQRLKARPKVKRDKSWWQKWRKQKRKQRMKQSFSNKPWTPKGALRCSTKLHYVNRGTSSN